MLFLKYFFATASRVRHRQLRDALAYRRLYKQIVGAECRHDMRLSVQLLCQQCCTSTVHYETVYCDLLRILVAL